MLGVLSFVVLIPLALLNSTSGFIPELFVFAGLTLFFWWTYDSWRLNDVIFTLLVLGLLSHAMGILGWYGNSPLPVQWDHISHFFGLLPWSLLFFRFVEQWMNARIFSLRNFLLLLVVFASASGVGAVIELSEFVGFLQLGFGDGAFQFGTGDGLETLAGATDKIDDIGGGWINTGWDLLFNTLGILIGMAIMIVIRAGVRKPERAYYFEDVGEWSKKVS